MKTYKVKFTGRCKGAIGRTFPITEKVQATTEEKATLALYDKYEHISSVTFKIIKTK